MSMIAKLLTASVLASTVAIAAPANAAGTISTSRTAFQALLTQSLTDDYGAAYAGSTLRSDAAMTAIVKQTTYRTTGYANWNILSNGGYCAGCNGSFTLGFDKTSFGTSAGVFGAGVDLTINSGYTAFVTYGDGSTENVALGQGFFGVTSSAGVKSIAFGLPNAGTTMSGSFVIDNLTIGAGAVPEPASWAMMILGMGAVGGMMRSRTRTTVSFA